jgi:hypothetical protein
MPPLDPALVGLAVHLDRPTFERGVRSVAAWRATADEAAAVAAAEQLLEALARSVGLGTSDLSYRIGPLLEAVAVPTQALPELAKLARRFDPAIKNAVASQLPTAMRRAVYRPDEPIIAVAADTRSGVTKPPERPSPPPPEPSAALASPAQAPDNEAPSCRTILLLGAEPDHTRNHRMLSEAEFNPLRVSRLELLQSLLTQEVCGIVISRSWWAAIPTDQHVPLLQRLVRHSSFAWLKVDIDGLHGVLDMRTLCREIRHEEPSTFECAFLDSCQITQLDLPAIRRASDLLTVASTIRLRPEQITEDQARVLLGAASKHVAGRHPHGNFRLTRVETTHLAGGRSDAQVVRLRPDDGGAPLVAKIDTLANLEGEMRRFNEFVAWWDDALRPRIHFHAGTGLILFSLVEAGGRPGQPAPTLEDRIESALFNELRDGETAGGPSEPDLTSLIDRAVTKLEGLNGRPCHKTSAKSFAWLGLEGLDRSLGRGINWSIADPDGRPLDVFAIRNWVGRTAAAFGNHGTVHGDVHLRNILVRDDREPHFIDYAYSGPGHPCFDLVRFASAILFRCFRPTSDECEIAGLLLAVLRGEDEEQLIRSNSMLTASIGNRLAIRALAKCMRASFRVLRLYNGKEVDFYCVQYVIACQSLLYLHLQTSVVRSVLSALGSLLQPSVR